MKTVQIGILGCANIVEKQIAAALREVASCQLVAIASRDSRKAKAWAEKLSCSYEQSYELLLSRKDLDAVYIPLPVGLHAEWVIKAAQAGKHIICEKSLGESLASVNEMIRACQKNNLHLYENFMCDYHPQHEKVLSLIHRGEIGNPILFRGAFGFPPLEADNIRYHQKLGGGSLNDVGTYPLFMSRKIFNEEPGRVTCTLNYEDKEVDIVGNAFLEFPGGKSAFLSFGFNHFYQNNYSVWGETGLINVGRAYSIPPTMKPRVELQKQDLTQNLEMEAANHFVLIFSAFGEAILNGKKPDYAPLLSQARAMEALRLSAQEKRTVSLSEVG